MPNISGEGVLKNIFWDSICSEFVVTIKQFYSAKKPFLRVSLVSNFSVLQFGIFLIVTDLSRIIKKFKNVIKDVQIAEGLSRILTKLSNVY